MPRKPIHASNADRQRAYRQRQRTTPAPALLPEHVAALLDLVAEAGRSNLASLTTGRYVYVWPHQRREAERLDDLAAALGGEREQVRRLEELEAAKPTP
jgi:hypothetical protein